MRARKYGIMSLTVTSAIYGLSDVCCMKCVHLSLLSKEKTWTHFMRRSKNVNMRKYQKDILHNWRKLYRFA